MSTFATFFQQNASSAVDRFVIWAEEAQQLNQNATEFSFGDRANNTRGILLPEAFTLYAFTFSAVTFTNNSQVEIHILKNDIIEATLSFNQNDEFVDNLNIPFTPGDRFNFRTGQKSGNISNVRVSVWFKK